MKKLDVLADGNKYVNYKDCSNLNFGESLADPTYYVSSAEAVKRVKDNSNVQGYYDFDNGVDNGSADGLVSLRRPGIDLAEVSQKLYKDTLDAQEEVNSLKEKIKKDTLDRLNNIGSSSASSVPGQSANGNSVPSQSSNGNSCSSSV